MVHILKELARFWDSQLSENQHGYLSTKEEASGFDTKEIACLERVYLCYRSEPADQALAIDAPRQTEPL